MAAFCLPVVLYKKGEMEKKRLTDNVARGTGLRFVVLVGQGDWVGI